MARFGPCRGLGRLGDAVARAACAIGMGLALQVSASAADRPTEPAAAASGALPPAPAAVASAAASAAPASAASNPSRLPLEYFAEAPEVEQLSLSPDGNRLAALMNLDDHSAVVVTRVDGSERARVLLKTDNVRYHLRWVRWLGERSLVAAAGFASQRSFVETDETRLLAIDLETGQVRELLRDPLEAGRREVPQVQDRIVDWLPDEERLLVAWAEEGSDALGVYELRPDGRRRLVQRPVRDVRRWMTDAQHRVRLAVLHRDGRHEVRVREPGGDEWRTLWSFDPFGAEAVRPLGFDVDPQLLYVLADHEGRDALHAVRLDDPALPRELKLASPRGDLRGWLLRDPASGAVIGMHSSLGSDTAADPLRGELWEPGWRAQLRALDRALPEEDVRVLELSRDGRRYLVETAGPRQAPRYFVGNRDDGALVLVGQAHPGLAPEAVAPKRPVAITARDGLELAAYLTLPRRPADQPAPAPAPAPASAPTSAPASRPAPVPEPAPAPVSSSAPAPAPASASVSSPAPTPAPGPLVLLPHGGPHARDDLDLDVWPAFLADRGHAVLQVDFRGSDGHGHALRSAGLQRWGLEMQDDLADAVQWAIERGIADPSRICIVGASYGGYAALMGAVKTPELYRCAASIAGVTDLPDLVARLNDYVGGDVIAERMIGHAWRDRERLRATSPARQAERIRAPVLLVHGSADRRVPVEQSRDMAAALKRAGKAYRYIELEGGDHPLTRRTHRIETFRALEVFLDEQIGAGR